MPFEKALEEVIHPLVPQKRLLAAHRKLRRIPGERQIKGRDGAIDRDPWRVYGTVDSSMMPASIH